MGSPRCSSSVQTVGTTHKWLVFTAFVSMMLLLILYAASTAIGSAYFGPGTGPINLDNVQCTGTEQSIFNCSFLATHNCVHREDASVVCLATQGVREIIIVPLNLQ